MVKRRIVIHGPMYQAECKKCDAMLDCWDTQREAVQDAEEHVCSTGPWMSLEDMAAHLRGNGYEVRRAAR